MLQASVLWQLYFDPTTGVGTIHRLYMLLVSSQHRHQELTRHLLRQRPLHGFGARKDALSAQAARLCAALLCQEPEAGARDLASFPPLSDGSRRRVLHRPLGDPYPFQQEVFLLLYWARCTNDEIHRLLISSPHPSRSAVLHEVDITVAVALRQAHAGRSWRWSREEAVSYLYNQSPASFRVIG